MARNRSDELSLELSAPHRWGGRRAGAGRKAGRKPHVPHEKRAAFRRLPAHVTLRLRPDLPSLRTVPLVRELERSFAAACARPGFRLAHYSLQANHAHLIVEATDRDALGRGMKSIGARIARAVNRISQRRGRVLAERYHLRLLPTPKEVRGALRYVLLNARRHAAKLRAAPKRGGVVLDPASPSPWFDGWNVGDRARVKTTLGHGAKDPGGTTENMVVEGRVAPAWTLGSSGRTGTPGPVVGTNSGTARLGEP